MENGNGNGLSFADFAAMQNNTQSQWMNNPFLYLLWMMFFGGNGFGGFGNNGANQAVNNAAQIQNLQDLVTDNHNNDLTMQAIGGNTAAITQLASILNTSTDNITAAINAMSQNMQNNSCQVKTSILEQGYQNQLANCQQTNAILNGFAQAQNSIANLGSALGYQIQSMGCEIKTTSTANTQHIIDTLNNHWTTEQQGVINSLQSQLSEQRILTAIASGNGNGKAASVTNG